MAKAQPIRVPEIEPKSDAQAVRLNNLVAGDDKIGGDVATITLEPGKNQRWFRSADFCVAPQQSSLPT